MTGAPADLPPAYYLPLSPGRFRSTAATASPWDPERFQHGGPPTALLAAAIDDHLGDPGLRLAQVASDFLGPVPQGDLSVEVEDLRPGRRVRQTEARLLGPDGRLAARARTWHIAPGSIPIEAPARHHPVPPLPEPPGPDGHPWQPDWGYGRSIEFRFVSGSMAEPGPCRLWMRPRIPLIEGRPATGQERVLICADSANGASAELSWHDWLFIPPSITVVLRRHPAGEWIFMDATSHIAGDGIGLAEAVLADLAGHLGIAVQPLLVAPAS